MNANHEHTLCVHTAEEAAAILRCEPGWLEEQARQKAVPHAELNDCLRFTDAHLTAILAMNEPVPVLPRAVAWSLAEAAVLLRCKASWLQEQARLKRIPYVKLSGFHHFTDDHLSEIIRILEVRPREVRPREVTPARAPRSPVLPQPAPGREHVELRARAPRTRGKRGNP
jgi:hypothetical protein